MLYRVSRYAFVKDWVTIRVTWDQIRGLGFRIFVHGQLENGLKKSHDSGG